MTVGNQALPLLPIGSVERDTGLSKDTLRIWERRYGFPTPLRDAHGERAYPPEQVKKLRVIKGLMDRGMRPGKIMSLGLAELLSLSEPSSGGELPVANENVEAVLALVRAHQVDKLRHELSQIMMRQGAHRFLIDTVSPLNWAIGEAWIRGELEVFEEHLYTEVIQGLLRAALSSMPRGGDTPRVLLTTLPNEPHILGLLMAEIMLAIDGARCVSLGTETPMRDIVRAAASQNADIVALSFSGAYPSSQVVDALSELRTRLPATIELWAGGTNPALARCKLPGLSVVSGLDEVSLTLGAWRAAHPIMY